MLSFRYKITKKKTWNKDYCTDTSKHMQDRVSATLRLEKLRCNEDQRTTPRRLAPFACIPPLWKDPRAVCLPCRQQWDHVVVPQLPGGHRLCMWYSLLQNKVNSWVCLHNKSHYKNHEMQQTFPSGTQNAKLPLSSIPEETFLGAITTTIHSPGQGSKKFILLQSLFYCFSSGRRTREKSFEDAEGCHYIASI